MQTTDFILFSDIHCHNFAYGATRKQGYSGGLYNSRLLDSVAVLDEIFDYAHANRIDNVAFGGDLFHVRTNVPTDVRHLVVDKLLTRKQKLHLLVGNHDMGDKYGEVHHLVGLAEPGALGNDVAVFDKPGMTWIGDWLQLYFLPYCPDLEEVHRNLAIMAEDSQKARNDGITTILVAHLGMQGARVGSDYVLVSKADPAAKDIPHGKFDACFFGHYHEHQQIFENGWFIGATHQHNWGDENGSRGFLHVSVERCPGGKVSFKQIETNAPKFLTMTENDFRVPRPCDFVKYVGNKKFLDNVEPVSQSWEKVEISEKKEGSRLELTKLDLNSMLEQWVGSKDVENSQELLELGKQLISEVM